jgi:hypothetical protein
MVVRPTDCAVHLGADQGGACTFCGKPVLLRYQRDGSEEHGLETTPPPALPVELPDLQGNASSTGPGSVAGASGGAPAAAEAAERAAREFKDKLVMYDRERCVASA